MAKKFFYNKVYNPKKRKIITIIVIVVALVGIAACFLLTRWFSIKKCENAVVKIKDEINVEINSKLPEKSDYFTDLQCINLNSIEVISDNVQLDKLGTYEVYVTAKGSSYTVKINVVDNAAPQLSLKELTIKPNTSYTYNDFVESCSDDSKEECVISFYESALDENGNVIKYDGYSSAGEYEIKIVAKDSANNQVIEKTKLIISDNSQSEDPNKDKPVDNKKACEYGDKSYSNQYVLTQDITVNGCAIAKDSYISKESSYKEHIVSIADTETRKVQAEINEIKDLDAPLTLNRDIKVIPSSTSPDKDHLGYVGFSLRIEVLDNNNKTVVNYYLKADGTRSYVSNPYNLK